MPLIIQMVLSVLSVIFLPLVLPFLRAAMSTPGAVPDTSAASVALILTLVSGSIWISVILGLAGAALCFFTFKAVQQGKSWARVVAIVLFILGLLSFPFGTILGIFGLIGAFDPEVTAYCNR